ncbi:MAG: GNAT family N-acetyltransferase, partial [Pseudomonadota bacterium]
METNALGQPVGPEVPGWAGAKPPDGRVLEGRHVVLAPLEMGDAPALFEAYAEDESGADCTYLFSGPYGDVSSLQRVITGYLTGPDLFYCICDTAGRAVGQASYLRIAPEAGSIEVG